MAFDYSLTLYGPVHLARGKNLYRKLIGWTSGISAPGETVIVRVTTLPAGVTAIWTKRGQDYSFFWQLHDGQSGEEDFALTAAADAALGTQTVVVTATSETGVIHTISFDIIVEDMPTVLPTPTFGPRQDIDVTTLAKWETLMSSSYAVRIAQPANILVGNELGSWYYDGIDVFNHIAQYTGDSSWYALAENIRGPYRDWVNGNPNPPGRRKFTRGFYTDSQRRNPASTEYAEDLLAIFKLCHGGTDPNASGQTNISIYNSSLREFAYSLEANIDCLLTGQTPYPSWHTFVDYLLGNFDAFRTGVLSDCNPGANDPNYPLDKWFIQPMMYGIAGTALIRYYEYTVSQGTPDTRVPVALKAFGDWVIGRGADGPTITDLEVDSVMHSDGYSSGVGGPWQAIRSLEHPFQASDLHKSVVITDGTGWNAGAYTIIGTPDAGGWVTVDRAFYYPNGPWPSTLGNANKSTAHVENWNAWCPGYKCYNYFLFYNSPTISLDNIVRIDNDGYDQTTNALISPILAWLYKMYGESAGSQYRIFGDMTMFSVTEAVNWSFALGSVYGKGFNQVYRRTFDYVDWRLNNDWNTDTPSAPSITSNPSNQSVNDGAKATFIAAASGNPTPTVQWQLSTNGGSSYGDIGGATDTTYEITASYSQNGYKYRAVFTNTEGMATTTAATLTVAPPASNDATAYTLAGPSSCIVGQKSGIFTISAVDGKPWPSGTVITPHSTIAGTFTPASMSLSATTVGQFQFTANTNHGSPTSITVTNNKSMANPPALSVTVKKQPPHPKAGNMSEALYKKSQGA